MSRIVPITVSKPATVGPITIVSPGGGSGTESGGPAATKESNINGIGAVSMLSVSGTANIGGGW